MNKSNLILASVSAIIFTSILIIFSPNSQKLNFSTSVPSPTPSQSISPTPDPTADWKTYENKEYGFSFQYPSQYKIYETMEFLGFEKMWGVEITDPNQKDVNPVTGETYNGKVFSLLTLASNFIEDTNPTLSPKKTVTIGNNKYLYYSPDTGMYPTYNYEIGKFFFFTDQENFHLVNSVFNQILSTFKFTDNTAVIPSSITTFYTAVNSYFKSNIAIIPEKQFYFSQGMIDKPSWSLDISKVDKEKGLVGDVFINQFNMEIGPGGGDQGGGGRVEFVNDKLDCYYSTGYNSTGGQETWNDSNSFSNILCTEK